MSATWLIITSHGSAQPPRWVRSRDGSWNLCEFWLTAEPESKFNLILVFEDQFKGLLRLLFFLILNSFKQLRFCGQSGTWALSGSPVFLVALVGPAVLWHLANPEMQRQTRIQLIYGLVDGCTVGCAGGRSTFGPGGPFGPGTPMSPGKPFKKYRDMCCSAAENCFCKLTEDFGMNVEQTAVREVRGGVCFTLWVKATEDVMNCHPTARSWTPFKHICHDAIIHDRQEKNVDAIFSTCRTSLTVDFDIGWDFHTLGGVKNKVGKTRGRLQTNKGWSRGRCWTPFDYQRHNI